ncbi:MAG: hypothetical protein B7Y77_01340 [Bradyrhizobium sp. 35-63-5]|nr:MAG: hypothetical protein B7Y77_01340 [Bradyrhizobium sp. 35-63-5]
MFIPDPNDRLPAEMPKRDFQLVTLAVSAVFFVAAIGGIGYSLFSESFLPHRAVQAYATVFQTLGISLPTNYEPSAFVVRYLDQLRREPCDREAIKPFAEQIERAGYPRESAKSLESFTARCNSSAELLEPAYMAYERLSDHLSAIRIASELMRLDPAYPRWPYLRGSAYEQKRDYQHALNDYVTTLQLFQNTSNVVVNEFYRISRMFDALGRPCEAITPLETYIAFDPSTRRTNQLVTLIKNYSAKGNCQQTYANGADRILMQDGNNVVDVTVNGISGRFIVDTGASFVSITNAFAERANLMYDGANVIKTKTAGGTLTMALGKVTQIVIGKTDASDVTVAIAPKQQHTFGENVDGLLGMSFLTRFDVTVSAGYLELRRRNFTE